MGPLLKKEFMTNNFIIDSVNLTGKPLIWVQPRGELRLSDYAAGKICTEVILGLVKAESLHLRWGQLLLNLYINLK